VTEQAWRPSRAELEAARDRLVPDVVGPGLRVLFAGINPGLYTAAVGHHFARPGNRFWGAIHGAGLTDRVLSPFDDVLLLEFGLGCTNLVPRATARAEELTPDELRAGGERLHDLVLRHRPAWLAVLGVTAYRAAFQRPRAAIGPQSDRMGPTSVWLLPNPSGLNAHYQRSGLVQEYRRLRDMLDPQVANVHSRGPGAPIVLDPRC
jgi:TDG/mug DNA glycosylase family protein